MIANLVLNYDIKIQIKLMVYTIKLIQQIHFIVNTAYPIHAQ